MNKIDNHQTLSIVIIPKFPITYIPVDIPMGIASEC